MLPGKRWGLLLVTLAGCLDQRTVAPCVTDADCAYDRICVSQACTDPPEVPPCVEDCEDPVPVKGPCMDHSDCGFKERCNFATGTCVNVDTIGACTSDAQCDPPNTICDRATERCVDGCLGDPCLVGFVCNEGTGHCVDQAKCEADRLEPNNSSNDAVTPGTVEPTLRACAEDGDFFRLTLNAGDTATVRIDYDEAEGDLALELVGESAPVTTAPGTASLTFTTPADGIYTARVALDQDLGQEPGAFYDLSVDVTWASCVEDAFEDDDTVQEASPIGAGIRTDINICEADDDFFVFVAQVDDVMVVDAFFEHAEGDVDVTLFDPTGTVIAEGRSTDNNERVAHTALLGGDYAVRVYLVTDDGQRAGTPYRLQLGMTTPARCVPDTSEPNDGLLSPAPIVIAATPKDLSLCPSNDDYFTFDAPAAATLSIDANFSHAEGDLDLALLDQTGADLASSNSTTDDESIVYTTTSSATLFVRMTLAADNGAVPGNTYDLAVDVSACTADVFEPNNTSANAVSIPFAAHPGLTLCDTDEDFYLFQLAVGQGVDIDLNFLHAEGDIDVELLTDTGMLLVSSVSGTDNEIIRFSTQVGGTYVLRVYLYADAGTQPGNDYDLILVRN